MAKQSKTKMKRPSVSIIGAGKVGQALAHALQASGYPLISLVFRNQEKVRKFSSYGRKNFPRAELLAFDNLGKLPKSDLILITTPDDVIEDTAKKLAALGRPLVNPQTGSLKGFPGAVLHTSGALSSIVLSGLAQAGCQIGSMHPLVSVTDRDPNAVFEGAYFCLEGEKMAVIYAEGMVRDLGGTSFRIKTDSKALYHAAAVMASPHLVALFDLAVELLTKTGVPPVDARKVLLPLVESTVRNLHAAEPSVALTGPFARGDVSTIERHLKVLSTGKGIPSDALEVYKLLGLRSLQVAKKNRLDPARAKQIKKLLRSGGKGKGERETRRERVKGKG
jgi:predicted short-subunit dehydrogenase-like oxidoreductase (DUF2520 family)